MAELSRAIIIGIGIALFGLLLQATPLRQMEATIGLEWLFKLRGPRQAPNEVVVITIDKESSTALNLPNLPRKWPRHLHAQLVRQLHQAGARVIAFDIIFSEPRSPDGDHAFAEAMQDSGNVILFEYLETRLDHGIHLEKRIPPIPLLQQSARVVAPFTLPKVPEKIDQAWLYKTASDAPTIPVVALHLFVAPELESMATGSNDWLATLPTMDIPSQIRTARQFLRQAPEHAAILQQASPYLQGWVAAMTASNGIFLDFYGPARAINTIPYHLALSQDTDTLRRTFAGKAVFVGFSERLQPEQKDGFYTVFTDQAGLDISGVEIMATTFANLVEHRSIRPAATSLRLVLVLGFGFMAGLLLYLNRGYRVLLVATLIGGLYLALACWFFNTQALWLPVTTPLLWELPLALVIAMLGHYLFAHKQRHQLDSILRQYLPGHIADTAFLANATHARREGEVTRAACMSSDAEAFTPLSEKLSAAQLHERINRYFQLLLPCISQQGGRIADINGDAVLALWHEQDDKTQRLAACLAALEIQRQLQADPDAGLPTRIGLHWGEIALGNVGHDGHYEYRAVGETVNTTSRLETLNKTLGTRILASTTLLDGCDDILYRPLGNFLLQGKQTPIAVAEVQGRHQAASQLQQRLNDLFHRAYCTYLQREFLQAARLFEQIRLEFNDPVSAFYKRLCLSLSTAPPSENWDGAIVMTSK